MDLIALHKQRQKQMDLVSLYESLQISYQEQLKILSEQKLEIIDCKNKAHYWKTQFKRSDKKKEDLLSEISELKAQLAKREQQLFGRKSEKHQSKSEKSVNDKDNDNDVKKSRGQQLGSKGHGRRPHDDLPVVEEAHDLPDNQKSCPCCGLAYESLAATEDSNIVELINVQGYTRKIRRNKYQRSCQCKETPKFIDAPPASRIFPKTRYGISIWAYLLLQKYAYHQPTSRTITQLSACGISLAQGTVLRSYYHY